MQQVEIQLLYHNLQWSTFTMSLNQPWAIRQAMESLQQRYPDRAVRAMLNGHLIDILPASK